MLQVEMCNENPGSCRQTLMVKSKHGDLIAAEHYQNELSKDREMNRANYSESMFSQCTGIGTNLRYCKQKHMTKTLLCVFSIKTRRGLNYQTSGSVYNILAAESSWYQRQKDKPLSSLDLWAETRKIFSNTQQFEKTKGKPSSMPCALELFETKSQDSTEHMQITYLFRNALNLCMLAVVMKQDQTLTLARNTDWVIENGHFLWFENEKETIQTLSMNWSNENLEINQYSVIFMMVLRTVSTKFSLNRIVFKCRWQGNGW